MIRTQIYITKREKNKLEIESNKTGISMAELIRRILDKYLFEKNEKNQYKI